MKVLITSVSAGAGHMRAAQAVESAFKIKHPTVEAFHVNVMDLVSKAFRKVYEDGYMLLADRAPAMWGWIYEATGKNGNHSSAQRAINAFQRNCAQPFLAFLEKFRPDVILTTHFLTTQILSSGRTFPAIPVEVVVTDYDLHRIWLSPLSRRYYVGDAVVGERFERYGINSARVTASGIPVHPDFSTESMRFPVLSRLNLNPNIPTLLLLSGGLGFGSLEMTLRRLIKFTKPLQIITVSGRNAEMRARLEKLPSSKTVVVRNLGFVDNMPELLSAADLVVTKAGGLTTAECLAKGVPMVVMSALPGQEQKNADFVLSREAGWQPNNLDQLASVVASLLNAPRELARLSANARAAGKPRAAFTIADSVLNPLCVA